MKNLIIGFFTGVVLFALYDNFIKPKSAKTNFFSDLKDFDFEEFIESTQYDALKAQYYKKISTHGKPITYEEARQIIGVRQSFLTKSLWFSNDTLVKYLNIWTAKENATGTRVYLGKYPPGTVSEGLAVGNLPTIVFVPTKDSLSTDGKIKYRIDVRESISHGYAYPVNRGYSCPPYPDSVCLGQSY